MKNKDIVLAYSGGLDTSFCIPYLIDQGFRVHAISINTGSFTDKDVKQMKKQAIRLGATTFACHDISQEYYDKCIKYLVYGNVLRGDTYPLSVSSERAFQAMAVLRYLKKVKAKYVAHGSTGAGNDQVRFDLIFRSLAPKVKIITPIRDHGFSRQEEVDFLAQKGFDWPEEKKNYSINQGIWGTSIGGKETLTSSDDLPEAVYPKQLTRTKPKQITLGFKRGEVTSLNGKKLAPLQLIKKLDQLAGAFAIGRDIHVGDTIVGIKGRVGFEAAAALIIVEAHQLLEKHTLSKWQAHWKKQLADWYGMQLHEGQYLDPSMRDIEAFLTQTQRKVSGEVTITLSPYHFKLNGIQSKNDLMNAKFGAYGESNTRWTGEDVRGFTNILATPHSIYYSIHKNEKL